MRHAALRPHCPVAVVVVLLGDGGRPQRGVLIEDDRVVTHTHLEGWKKGEHYRNVELDSEVVVLFAGYALRNLADFRDMNMTRLLRMEGKVRLRDCPGSESESDVFGT